MIHKTLILEGQDGDVLQNLPAKYRVTGDRFAGSALLFFAFIFGTESIVFALSALMNGTFATSVPGTKHFVLAPLGLLFLLWGLNQFVVRGELTIDKNGVRCRYRNIAGRHEWIDALSNYRGIEKKIEHSAERAISRDRYFCVWLRHKKRSRSIRLFKASSDSEWDQQTRSYSTMFGLPVLD